jgi:hypothetical protein
MAAALDNKKRSEKAEAIVKSYMQAVVECASIMDTHTASSNDVRTIAMRRDEWRKRAEAAERERDQDAKDLRRIRIERDARAKAGPGE